MIDFLSIRFPIIPITFEAPPTFLVCQAGFKISDDFMKPNSPIILIIPMSKMDFASNKSHVEHSLVIYHLQNAEHSLIMSFQVRHIIMITVIYFILCTKGFSDYPTSLSILPALPLDRRRRPVFSIEDLLWKTIFDL